MYCLLAWIGFNSPSYNNNYAESGILYNPLRERVPGASAMRAFRLTTRAAVPPTARSVGAATEDGETRKVISGSRRYVMVLTALFATVGILKLSGVLTPLNLWLYDLSIPDRQERPADVEPVLIVGVSDEYLAKHDWPLDNADLAKAVEALTDAGAAAVGIDLYRDHREIAGSPRLEEVMRKNGNVIGIDLFRRSPLLGFRPYEPMAAQGRIGFSDMVLDADGVVRRRLLALDDGRGNHQFAFALRLALEYLADRGIEAGGDGAGHMVLGEAVYEPLPDHFGGYNGIDNRGYQHMIDFGLAGRASVDLPFREVIDGGLAADMVKDRIAIIGVKSDYVKDNLAVPAGLSAYDGGLFHGVVLHGLLAYQYVSEALGQSRPMADLHEAWEYAILGGLLLLGFGLPHLVGDPRIASAGVVAGAALVAAVGVMLHGMYVWYPAGEGAAGLFAGGAAGLVSSAVAQRRSKAYLRGLFSRFISEPLLEEVWRNREALMSGGMPAPRRLYATVLFIDIAGSTSISERLDAREYIDWLAPVLERLGTRIVARGGVIEKFQGDGLMAVFGVPLARRTGAEREHDAAAALDSMTEIAADIAAINARQTRAGSPRVGIRAGIASGEVVGGCVGTRDKIQYTVTGIVASTAARLEALGKELRTEASSDDVTVLVSDETRTLIGDRFALVPVGEFALRGKAATETVYRLLLG